MKKGNGSRIFWILFVATIIDLIVPDPVPFVDEVLLIAASIFSFIKTISRKP